MRAACLEPLGHHLVHERVRFRLCGLVRSLFPLRLQLGSNPCQLAAVSVLTRACVRLRRELPAELRELLGLLEAQQVQLIMYLAATQRVVIVLVMNDLHDVRHVPVHLLLAVLPLLERAFHGRGRGIDKREPHGRPRPRRRSRSRQ